MENEKKIVYSQHFTKKIQEKIEQKEKEFKFFYHVVITYRDKNQFNQVFKHIFNNNKNLISFNWVCGTKRKFNNKANNRHKKRYHSHSVVFSDVQLSEELILKTFKDLENLDIKIILGYDLKGLLGYIFDGHHIFKSSKIIKKIRRLVFNSFKTILKKLSISMNIDFIYKPKGVIMKT